MDNLTTAEQTYLDHLQDRLLQLRAFLNREHLDTPGTIDWWFSCIQQMRALQGNTSNDSSFIVCLLAKRYLASRFEFGTFDVAAKLQGAAGLDIDLVTVDDERIIAEIKTTVPYTGAKNDLGANQKASFQKDFTKLRSTPAKHKFFFVTDQGTFDLVKRKYSDDIPGVEVVLLTRTATHNI